MDPSSEGLRRIVRTGIENVTEEYLGLAEFKYALYTGKFV